jgi:hypothetical protein
MVIVMSRLSEHTLLMNVIICLTRKNKDLPSSLYNLGYQLEFIGPRFTTRMGEPVNPDISIKGHSERTLFLVDCKSGGLKHKQAQIYAKLTPEDVISAGVSGLDSKGLIVDVAFAGGNKAEPKLLEAEALGNYGLPILILDNLLLQKRGDNEFKNQNLEGLFSQGVTFRGKLPTGFYPFSPDDSRSHILAEIAPVLYEMHRRDCEFSEDDLLEKAHPYYECFDDQEKRQLKSRIGSILSSIPKEHDYRFLINKQNKWKIDSDMTPQRLQKAIQEFINKIEEADKQTTLPDLLKRASEAQSGNQIL